MKHPDVAIIGAGIVGAACAAELARHGLQVEVLDAAGIGGGATGAGMGHLVVMDDSPAEFALSRWSVALWHKLAPQLGAAQAFKTCGTLMIAANAQELNGARARLDTLRAGGVACEMLDARQLQSCEPALRAGLPGALRIPGDAIVYAPAVAAWLLGQTGGPPASLHQASGKIRLRLGSKVVALAGNHLTLADGSVLQAGAILVASGMQAVELVPGLPLVAKKGHLLITDRYPGTIHHQLLELGYIQSAHQASGASVAFNAQPRPSGQILIGSSRQFDSADTAIEPPILARMLRRAADYLPALPALQAIRAWTGLRAATPDGLPLIGPAPGHTARAPHWVAAGHEGLGVTTSLATARLIAAQMLNLAPEIPPGPYLPDRFAPAA